MYRIVFEKTAIKDLEKLKACGLSNKAKNLVEVIKKNPYQNPPRYEKLVGNLDGLYSRRINIQHRLVYKVYEEKIIFHGVEYDGTIKIIRLWTHYSSVR